MNYRRISFMFGLCAALGFAFLSGCDDKASTTTVSESEDHDHDHGDHDHGDHDHDHGDHDHDHGDHDHDHGDHDHDHGDHDHGDHDHDFGSLDDAVAEIVELRDEIRDGFKSGEANESAHGQLHHIFEVLTATEKVIEEMDATEEEKESLSAALESLFDGYGEVDKGLHGGEGKNYSDVSDSIDEAVETLSKASE